MNIRILKRDLNEKEYAKLRTSYADRLKVMNEKIDEAEESCGGEGSITIQVLRKALPTPAWAPLNDPGSRLCKVLLSEFFKDKKKATAADRIDVELLKAYALLH